MDLLHRLLTVAKFRLLAATQLLAAMLVRLWPGSRSRAVLEAYPGEMVQDVEEEAGDDSDDGRSSWPCRF